MPTSQSLDIGARAAVLLVGGLLWLNPGHLRELTFADRMPGIELALLLASFVITFGSAALGSAIMAQGRKQDPLNRRLGRAELNTFAPHKHNNIFVPTTAKVIS